MLYCLPTHSRSLIHQADLRFRDGAKEASRLIFFHCLDNFLFVYPPDRYACNILVTLHDTNFIYDFKIIYRNLKFRNTAYLSERLYVSAVVSGCIQLVYSHVPKVIILYFVNMDSIEIINKNKIIEK